MTVSAIVAVAENGVIGRDNDLIWYLPLDLQYFKRKTQDHVVIMGRKNYESIPEKFRPLPNRTNIVLTQNKSYSVPGGVHVVHTLEQALKIAHELNDPEPFVIGGGQIYQLALDAGVVDRLYITWVHHAFDGDAFFPELDMDSWELTSSERHETDARHPYPFTFAIYEKKPSQ